MFVSVLLLPMCHPRAMYAVSSVLKLCYLNNWSLYTEQKFNLSKLEQ